MTREGLIQLLVDGNITTQDIDEAYNDFENKEFADKELWSSAFNAVASAVNCKTPEVAINWADKALEAWKKKDK